MSRLLIVFVAQLPDVGKVNTLPVAVPAAVSSTMEAPLGLELPTKRWPALLTTTAAALSPLLPVPSNVLITVWFKLVPRNGWTLAMEYTTTFDDPPPLSSVANTCSVLLSPTPLLWPSSPLEIVSNT